MKRRFFLLLALAGLAWLYVRRGARRPQPVDRVPPPADPAEELRRKLDRTREPEPSYPAEPEPDPAEVLGVEQPQTEPAEPVEPSAPVVTEDLDARRREVHEQARSAADEMRRSSSD
jgi:hypothetical protein